MNLREIQNQFNQVIKHSQEISEPQTDTLFREWKAAKAHFIDKWGGLTYELEEEVALDRPESDKKILFDDFVADAALFASRPDVDIFLNLQGVESFYENKVLNNYESADGEIKICVGAKLSKALKFFFSNQTILDKFQTKLSRLIQDGKITGKMVISVHPLDFLSSAETAHNWHSCHALDGEFRAGNLSHMIDKHTFIAYIKAENDYTLPNFPFEWNSKKWRCVIYSRPEEDIFVAGRQYPFSNYLAMKTLKDKILNVVYDLNDFTEDWTLIGNNRIENIMCDAIGAMQYNDCLNSSCYEAVGLFNKDINLDFRWRHRMEIGDGVHCLECGGNMISVASGMVCDECAGYEYCECCGEPGYYDEMFYLEGQLVCENCFDDIGIFCNGCDETFDQYATDMIWDEEEEEYYCPDCYDNLIEYRERRNSIYGEL